MDHPETPLAAELPSSRQLLRSTAIAALAALVLLITVVLPAEYGIDPTGVGRLLRLTEMGEIKQRLAREAAADTAAIPASAPPAAVAVAAVAAAASEPRPEPDAAGAASAAAPAPLPPAAASQPATAWRDEVDFTLAPGQGTEIKLRMKQGQTALYSWHVEGGVVNYDTHGDGGGRSISYVKGRGVPADEGRLVAAFDGNHGWYWRNRGRSAVKLSLRAGGEYADLRRMK